MVKKAVVYKPLVDSTKLTAAETGIQPQQNILIEQFYKNVFINQGVGGNTVSDFYIVPQGKTLLLYNLTFSYWLQNAVNANLRLFVRGNGTSTTLFYKYLQVYSAATSKVDDTQCFSYIKPLVFPQNSVFRIECGLIDADIDFFGILVDKSVDLKQFFI